ncbi:hypothetical protein SAMN05421812_102602 [Asanoa hainanensis]|uniref:Uncharacterized protein n=1 Tax=Asanoa hainanensis TaxID=560556 RepID=A0A239IWC9_9ACTN|nr:hypothetical protein [Asanoa hainanensis]SNS97917.1 hypothetical protein SAMN05421812_102602 [Asanoa hainanensis]
MRQCLAEINADLSGQTIVGMHTATPMEARLTAERVHDLGGRYLGAGIQGSPEMIGAAAVG